MVLPSLSRQNAIQAVPILVSLEVAESAVATAAVTLTTLSAMLAAVHAATPPEVSA